MALSFGTSYMTVLISLIAGNHNRLTSNKFVQFELFYFVCCRLWVADNARAGDAWPVDTGSVSPAGLWLWPGAVPAVLSQLVQRWQGVLQVHALHGEQGASLPSGRSQCRRKIFLSWSPSKRSELLVLSEAWQQLQPREAVPGSAGQRGDLQVWSQQRVAWLWHRDRGLHSLRCRWGNLLFRLRLTSSLQSSLQVRASCPDLPCQPPLGTFSGSTAVSMGPFPSPDCSGTSTRPRHPPHSSPWRTTPTPPPTWSSASPSTSSRITSQWVSPILGW